MLRFFSFLLQKRPSDVYKLRVKSGEISFDQNQLNALPLFDRLHDDLIKYASQKSSLPRRQSELRPPNRLGIIPSFFLKRLQERKVTRALASNQDAGAFHPLSSIKGLYIWGGVGCGKTMLMDMLFKGLPLEIKKHRVHFHQFMLDVQKTTHSIKYISNQEASRKKSITGYSSGNRRRSPEAEINIFDEVAQRMVGNLELLCFDEVAVADVADAMILKRLFTSFYRLGIVVIFTSNRPPDALYLGGLNRGGFIPFIELVEKMNCVYHLPSKVDYRLIGCPSDTYLNPFSKENETKFNNLYLDCCKGMPSKNTTLQVFGRDISINRACGGVCYFHFHEICGSNMSTADYQVIANAFHTIFINGVPQFSFDASDVKNRFLVLIDTLYEYHCKVVIYAEVDLQLIQQPQEADHVPLQPSHTESGEQLIDQTDSSFQMERCISRLVEMRSKEYLQASHLKEGQ